MRERESIEQVRQSERRERVRINALAEEQGLRRFSHEYSTVWVPKDQEEGAILSKFFVQRYNKKDEVVFDEHRIAFPIKDPSQLSESLQALNVLYSRVENAVVYDRNDPTRFVEFVDGLVEPNQPKV